jgi:hypothetical protein
MQLFLHIANGIRIVNGTAEWPCRKTPPNQAELQKIADAVEDVALKSAILKFGDNMELDIKAQALKY